MTGKGWITGEDIRSKPYDSEEVRDNFDRIFKKGKYSEKPTELEMKEEYEKWALGQTK